MNQEKFVTVVVVGIVVILTGITSYFVFVQTSSPTASTVVLSSGQLQAPSSTSGTSSTSTQPTTSIVYRNTQFGFQFTLPESWKGYTIVTSTWEGFPIDDPTAPHVTGTELSIRHPLWTSENPRQDIPIMIFTPTEWNQILQEKLSVSAAPIPPSELGMNATSVFALPARYNYAFPTGFEEVQTIIDSKPLQGF